MTQDDDPDVAELARLDADIPVLVSRAEQARVAWGAAEHVLATARHQRNLVAARLDARTRFRPAQRATSTTPTAGAPGGATVAVGAPALVRTDPGAPETSTRTLQNLLFVLGGLLLSIAAVVFTAVAWTSYGLMGRAAILAIATAVVLAAPLVALWRKLRATAETFAGVGLLLVVLDGYAIWDVNLFDVNTMPSSRYTGLVAVVTAVLATGYGLATRLVGPGFVAMLVAQPVIPLLLTEAKPDLAGWSLIATAVVALNLAIVWWVGRRENWTGSGVAVARQVLAVAVGGTAWLVAAGNAISALSQASTVEAVTWAGAAMLAAAVVAVPAAGLTRAPVAHLLAAAGVTLAVLAVGSRLVTVVWPEYVLALAPAVVTVVALVLWALRSVLPAWSGAAAATAAAAAIWALGLLGSAVSTALAPVRRAFPLWHAELLVEPGYDWQPLLAIGLITVVLLAIAPAVSRSLVDRSTIAVAAGAVAVLTLPAAIAAPWWFTSIVDVAVATVLLLLAVAAPTTRRANAPALAALLLASHAVLTSLVRPETTAIVLTTLALAGIGAAAVSLRGTSVPEPDPETDEEPVRVLARVGIGGSALLVGLAAIPPAIGSILVTADVVTWWTARLTIAAVLLVLAGQVTAQRLAPRLGRYARTAALVSSAVWPVVAALTGGDPIGVTAGVGLVLITSTLLIPPGPDRAPTTTGAAVAALPAAGLFAFAVVPAVVAVIVVPLAWSEAIWSGRPTGVGLGPDTTSVSPPAVRLEHAVALILLALAAAITGYAIRRTILAALGGLTVGGPTAILVGLVAAGAAWPTVPTVTLLLGVTMLVAVATLRWGPTRSVLGGLQAVAYVIAGLSGTLSVKWSTLAGLSSIVVGAAIVAVIGRTVAWRVGGWLTTAFAAAATAATAGFAADLPVRQIAFLTLAVAVLALATNAVLQGRRETEASAVHAAAQTIAALSLMYTLGAPGSSALLCCAWGIAVGLRALAPRTGRDARATLAAVAAGCQLLAWWLLLTVAEVTLVEAYTAPAAGVAVLVGWLALHSRPELRSWVAYGPALAAAFLPSLGLVMIGADSDAGWRRLSLGGAALAVVFAGAVGRRQAPVVVGGTVLLLVALHEIWLLWALVPSWIPLAAGGVLLVALAITYERRRRDLRWLRATIGRLR